MMRLAPPALLAALLATLAGCAGSQSSYPSLAPRPIETLSLDEPAPQAVALAPDPTLDAKIEAQRIQVAAATARFATDAAIAERAVAAARGARAGSDPWLNAQTALATLDNWRAQASALTAQIEQLAQDRAESLAAPYPALDMLRDAAVAESDHEMATIERLQRQLVPA